MGRKAQDSNSRRRGGWEQVTQEVQDQGQGRSSSSTDFYHIDISPHRVELHVCLLPANHRRARHMCVANRGQARESCQVLGALRWHVKVGGWARHLAMWLDKEFSRRVAEYPGECCILYLFVDGVIWVFQSLGDKLPSFTTFRRDVDCRLVNTIARHRASERKRPGSRQALPRELLANDESQW